jgi:hypothetical protein
MATPYRPTVGHPTALPWPRRTDRPTVGRTQQNTQNTHAAHSVARAPAGACSTCTVSQTRIPPLIRRCSQAPSAPAACSATHARLHALLITHTQQCAQARVRTHAARTHARSAHVRAHARSAHVRAHARTPTHTGAHTCTTPPWFE